VAWVTELEGPRLKNRQRACRKKDGQSLIGQKRRLEGKRSLRNRILSLMDHYLTLETVGVSETWY